MYSCTNDALEVQQITPNERLGVHRFRVNVVSRVAENIREDVQFVLASNSLGEQSLTLHVTAYVLAGHDSQQDSPDTPHR